MRARKFLCVVLAAVMLFLLAGCIYEGNLAESSSDGSDIGSGSSPVAVSYTHLVWNAQTHQRSLYYANLLRIPVSYTHLS